MAVTYLDRYNFGKKADTIAQVLVSMVKTAIMVQAESTETENHAERSSFSVMVLRDPERWAQIMAMGVVTQLTAANPTDATVDGLMASIWNAYAVQYVAPAT